MLMLEADNGVVRITDDDHVAGRLAAPAMGPQIVHVVQVDVRKIGEITAPCGVPRSLRVTRPSSVMPTFSHFTIRRRMRLSAIRCSRKRIGPCVGHGIEKALDIRVQHPVHLLPVNPGVERVQRIVLAAPRSENPYEKPRKSSS